MLTGKNVHLSPLRETDAEMLFTWINDPELVRLSASYKPVHWENHLKWFESVIKDDQRIIFGIKDHSKDLLIGVIQLIDLHPIHKNAELIIRIGNEEYQGKGYGREAIKLILDHAWQDLNLQRIWLRVFSNNTRAIAAYRAVNFVEEGILRQAAYINGHWENVMIMAILRPK